MAGRTAVQVEVQSLEPTIGGEVTGVDLRQPLAAEVVDQLRRPRGRRAVGVQDRCVGRLATSLTA